MQSHPPILDVAQAPWLRLASTVKLYQTFSNTQNIKKTARKRCGKWHAANWGQELIDDYRESCAWLLNNFKDPSKAAQINKRTLVCGFVVVSNRSVGKTP